MVLTRKGSNSNDGGMEDTFSDGDNREGYMGGENVNPNGPQRPSNLAKDVQTLKDQLLAQNSRLDYLANLLISNQMSQGPRPGTNPPNRTRNPQTPPESPSYADRPFTQQGYPDTREDERERVEKRLNSAMANVVRWTPGGEIPLEAYCMAVETAMMDRNIPSAYWALCLRMKLDSLTWTNYMASHPSADVNDYHAIKHALLAQFGERSRNPNPFLSLANLRLTRDMGMREHLNNFMVLKQKVDTNIPDDLLRQTLLGTLDSATLSSIAGLHRSFQDLVDDLYSKLPTIEVNRRSYFQSQDQENRLLKLENSLRRVRVAETRPPARGRGGRDFRPIKEDKLQSKPNFKRLTPEERADLASKGLCFYCKGPHHVAAGCPLKKRHTDSGVRASAIAAMITDDDDDEDAFVPILDDEYLEYEEEPKN